MARSGREEVRARTSFLRAVTGIRSGDKDFKEIKFGDVVGVGIWMVIFVAGGAVGVYCAGAIMKRQLPWLGIGLGGGAFLGLLIGMLRILL